MSHLWSSRKPLNIQLKGTQSSVAASFSKALSAAPKLLPKEGHLFMLWNPPSLEAPVDLRDFSINLL